MSTIIPVYFSKKQLNKINSNIVISRRSKLINQFILDYKYDLPKLKEGIQEIINWDSSEEDTVILPIFISESAVRKIDQLVISLKAKMDEFHLNGYVGRSTIIRELLSDFAEQVALNPITEMPDKQFILVTMPVGTKAKLNQYIDNMERSNTISSYLLEEYEHPRKSAKVLKERIKSEKEQLPLHLEIEAILKAENIAEEIGDKVKKSQIIRDAIYELIERLEQENPKRNELEENLKRSLAEMMKHTSPEEIKDILLSYNIDK